MLKKSFLIVLISVIVVLIFSACGSKTHETGNGNTPTPTPTVGVNRGNLAPDFVFSETINFENSGITKLSDLRGKIVFLHFWASWCSNCQKEMPSIESLYEKYKDSDFVIIAVNGGENTETINSFLAKNNYTFLIVLDEKKSISRNYHVISIPTTFILDKDGVIRAIEVGRRNWSDFQNQWIIDSLLSR